MNKTYIVFAFAGTNPISMENLPEKASEIIRSTAQSLIHKLNVDDVNVTIISEEDLLRSSVPRIMNNNPSPDELIPAEEHAIVFLCSKYVKDRQFLRKKFISAILSKDKETVNAVKILGRSELSYDQLVDIVDKKMVVKLAFTRPVYEQIQLAYSFIL